MVDTTHPFDFPTWSLDALDGPHALSLDTGFMTEEELQRYQFPPGYDAMAAQLLCNPGPAPVEQQQMSAKTDNFYDPLTNFAPADADKFPIFPPFYQLSKEPLSLDDLLRSTSQVATERALYMNNATLQQQQHPMPLSPSSFLDPGASPDTSHGSYSGSEDGWECHAQMMDLPDAFVPPAASDEDEGLTPLEMPDGSTRFTANWLPVDPQGGFTIGSPEKPRPAAAGAGNLFDLEFMNYHKEAFITTDTGV